MDPEGFWALYAKFYSSESCAIWCLGTYLPEYVVTSQKTAILLITLFTRAHHWSLLKPNPIHTFPFLFFILYCTAIIFLTRNVVTSDSLPHMAVTSICCILHAMVANHVCYTVHFMPVWSLISTADPFLHTVVVTSVHCTPLILCQGCQQCPLHILNL